MTLLPTQTVTFIIPGEREVDAMGEALPVSYQDFAVKNCLVQPAPRASQLTDGLSLQQQTSVNIHIPKSVTEPLTEGYAVVSGRRLRIVASTFPLTRTPLPWNRYVICEVISDDYTPRT